MELDDGFLCVTCTQIETAMRNHGAALRARYENLESDEDKCCFLASCLAVLGCSGYLLVDTGATKNVGGLQQAEDLQWKAIESGLGGSSFDSRERRTCAATSGGGKMTPARPRGVPTGLAPLNLAPGHGLGQGGLLGPAPDPRVLLRAKAQTHPLTYRRGSSPPPRRATTPMPAPATPSQAHLHPVPESPARSLSPLMSQTQPAAETDGRRGGASLPQFGDDSSAKRTVKRRSDSPMGPLISLASSSSSGTGGPPIDKLMVRASEQARMDLPADAPEMDILQRALEILQHHHSRTADADWEVTDAPRDPHEQRAIVGLPALEGGPSHAAGTPPPERR